MSTPTPDLSYLSILNTCDVAYPRSPGPPRSLLPRSTPAQATHDAESTLLIPFRLSQDKGSAVVGLVRPVVVQALREEREHPFVFGYDFQPTPSALAQQQGEEQRGPPDPTFVAFSDQYKTHAERTEGIRRLCERWRDEGKWEGVCGKGQWRGEMYAIYRDPFGGRDYPVPGQGEEANLNYAFEMERSACALFGVVTYGVHMSVYHEEEDGSLRVWVPTRAKSKPTWPGYLDNSVAGGIPAGMSAFEAVVKESEEEASIAEDVARRWVKCTGAISYFFRTETGWLQPEVEYVYDLPIPRNADFKPRPNDGEVECFELLSQDECISRMRKGLFKPNCALVIIDLLIRKGFITPDNEPDFMEINTRLRGRFQYERW